MRSFWALYVGSWLAVAGLGLLLEGHPARLDEPLLLRWIRVLPEHPVASPLALALGLWAVRPGRS